MKQLSLFVLLSVSVFATAQTESAIRAHYQAVNKQIDESIEQGYEGPLYHNQWVTNKNGRSWPAVGLYMDTTDFWFDDPPDHLPVAERNPRNVLLKVTVNRRASHLMSREEFLYKDGKLLFYFLQEGEEGKEWETRAWFNDKGSMFKSSVKEDGKELSAKQLASSGYSDLKPNALTIQKQGKEFQDLFVRSML